MLPLADGFGLHPSLPGFKKLWEAKQLAVIQGVGFANPNYSHFESMDIWQSGVPSEPVSTGWIGRWLDSTTGSPLRAVGIGPTAPLALSGAKVQGVMIPAGELVLPGDPSERALYAVLAGTTRQEALLLEESALANGNLLQVQKTLGPILDRSASTNPLHLEPNPGSSSTAEDAQQALAIANGGGGCIQHRHPRHSAQPGREPDLGRGVDPGLQRRAWGIRHPCRPGAHPEDAP